MTNWKSLITKLNTARNKKSVPNKHITEITGLESPHVARFFTAKHEPALGLFLSVAEAVGVEVELKEKPTTTPNGKKFLASLQAFSDSLTDEEKQYMFNDNNCK